mmetsp:Transcript_9327/g.12974  ORF Transcript_9327/g.12974 Transcript_9327/m.12974 type:complete len:130 (-) Transcript_9327:14-403(-)|eukprot:CAMPEP_0185725310 /NCGR_PEP_ID=MMETSP1171-20130828/1597_1 /TAXON_ID=374046 /ORGANISM="Helicotheca tamensis, Strain CCMP826" /LENGTH=129 /DNA_ID=CAMNT_0028393401 /DNA_START=251 /DNA_END=640 /DNA_ORIENTATION=-
MADSGASIINLKRAGGWKSDTVAEGYVADSEATKTGQLLSLLPDDGDESPKKQKVGPVEKAIKNHQHHQEVEKSEEEEVPMKPSASCDGISDVTSASVNAGVESDTKPAWAVSGTVVINNNYYTTNGSK